MFPTKKQFSAWSLPAKYSFISVLVGIAGLSLYALETVFDIINFSSNTPTISSTSSTFNSPPVDSITLEDIEKEALESKAEIEALSKRSDEAFEKLSRRNKQLDYLNGNSSRTNYEVFLNRYYGLNGQARIGDKLVEELLGQEVEWSVQVLDIIAVDEDDRVFVPFGVNNSVCTDNECPEDFSDVGVATFETLSDVPEAIKPDDYIHIRGTLRVFNSDDRKPETDVSNTLRGRMHIHYVAMRYVDE